MLAFLSVGCASAATYHVNPGDSIQAAIDAADPGDTIIVRSGIYTEDINVNKRLTIRSENGAASTIVQAANPNEHVFNVVMDEVNITGFTVTGAGDYKAGIYLDAADHCNITKNRIIGNSGGGMYLSHTSSSTIANNNISANCYGIFLDSCNDNLFDSNIIRDSFNGDGISMDNSNYNTLVNNTIKSNEYTGIGFWSSSNNLIYHNNLIDNSPNGDDNTGANSWDNGTEGNYWSDYSGIDAGGDGIGDTAYDIAGGAGAKDNYPFMEENGWITEEVNQPPTADFTYSPENPVVNQTITFEASNSTDIDGTIISYEWAFGDVTNGTGEIITHSYSSAGEYTVNLTVTDDDGLTNTTTQNITITSLSSEQGDWTKESGIRIEMGSVPYILRLDNGMYRMYYNNPGGIFSAISEDGINFTEELGVRLSGTGVLGDPEWQVHGATVVRLDNGSYRMYYVGDTGGEGGPYGCGIHRIYSAISPDGLSFTREGIRIESEDTIDNGWASVPEIVRTSDERYRLYYCAAAEGILIASAISDDGLNFIREYGPGIGNGTGVYGADPAVCKLPNGTYWMFFTSPGGPMPPWYLEKGIYSARSTDGVNFTKDSGVRVSPGGIYDSLNNNDPTVIALPDGRFRLYYGGESDQGIVTLSAISPFVPSVIFDTGPGTYPSIAGTHNGTITPDQDITVQKMYTYPCAGTGGHTEHITFYYTNGTKLAEGHWNGYTGDWHNISFDTAFTLYADENYNYAIRTGSYPQIIHEQEYKNATGGTITCTSFVDVNGKTYTDWIPAIRLE